MSKNYPQSLPSAVTWVTSGASSVLKLVCIVCGLMAHHNEMREVGGARSI